MTDPEPPEALLSNLEAGDKLTLTLASLLSKRDPLSVQHAAEAFFSMRDQMRAGQRRLSAMEHAHATHNTIDSSIEDARRDDPAAARVQCKPRCVGCCHIPVDITRAEATLVRAAAAEAGVVLDKPKLRRQVQHTASWHELTLQERRCALLGDDDLCRVYIHRPAACRKYHVVSDPELCDPIKHYGERVEVWAILQAEITLSAAVTVWGGVSLHEALLGPSASKPNARR